MARPLATKLTTRDPAELPVHRAEEPVHGIGAALADLQEEVGDLLTTVIAAKLGMSHRDPLCWEPSAVQLAWGICPVQDEIWHRVPQRFRGAVLGSTHWSAPARCRV